VHEYLPYFEVKEVGDDGTFRGIASVYGVEDLGGDVVDQGAMRKTIAENPVIPILWQHKSDEVIGQGTVKEWQNKVLIDGQLDMDDPTATKAHRKLKNRLIKGLSIGFTAVKTTFEENEKKLIRHIGELKLWEVSVVTFPMLPGAQVTRVKNISDREASLLEAWRKADSETQTSIQALLAKDAREGEGTPDLGAAGSNDAAAGATVKPEDLHLTLLRLRNAGQ
jgi:HK97 family phage prohead protease